MTPDGPDRTDPGKMVPTIRPGPEPLPLFHFRTGDLPDREALARWRELMAPLFHVAQARYSSLVPRGDLSVFVVGDILVNRCTFNAQHFSRDPALIAATPHHLVLQYYRSGGFRGTIAGRPVHIARGQVAVADLSREVDADTAKSDTIGLSVPRPYLAGLDPVALGRPLDPPRHALLGSVMAALPKRLAGMSQDDVPALTAELVAMLARVFTAGPLDADLAPAAPDQPLLERALAFIEAHLGAPDLSPGLLADRIGTSRATLYRLFAPMGGIMRYVQDRRLTMVRDILNDPLDRRSLAQLAKSYGFASQAILSRGFRAEFGVSPRDWRRDRTALDLAKRETSLDRVQALWRALGGHES